MPLHAPHDVADQVTRVADKTPGEETEHQVDFMEIAPVDFDFMPQPSAVDINYVESLRSFLSRPYPIFSSNWTGSDVTNTTMANLDPLLDYLNIPLIAGKLQGFEYLRAGLRIEIRINGTRFHYGQLTAGFLPLSNIKSYDSSQTHVHALTMFPGVTLDPGPSEVGIFEVPYVHPHHFIRITDTTAQAEVLRSLGSLYIKVLAPLQVVSQTTVPEVTFTVYASLVNPVLNGFTAAAQPSPLIVQLQSADSATRFVPEAMNFLATDINDVSVRGGMQGDNAVDNEEQYIGANRSDMLFSKIYEKPNFISSTTWTSANTPGALISHIPVRPSLEVFTNSHYLYQLARATRFWRGTLRYHFRFVASGFHSGRMLIGWEPNDQLNSLVNLPAQSNRLHMVVDLQQTTDVFFSIPYMQPRPWLNRLDQNGRLYFNVLNSLSTPSGEPTNIQILGWMYGGEDLEFAMPLVQIEAPGAILVQEQCATQPLSSPLFNNLINSKSVPGKMVMGESLNSVHQLLQKMTVANVITALAGDRQMSVFTSQFTAAGAEAAPSPASHISFLSKMFVLMRGGFRYAPIFYTSATLTTPVNEYFVGPCILGEVGTTPSYGSLAVRTTTPNAMVEVPWYSDELFVTTDTPNTNRVLPGVVANSRTGSALTWYAGATKDFMLAYLVPPPIG